MKAQHLFLFLLFALFSCSDQSQVEIAEQRSQIKQTKIDSINALIDQKTAFIQKRNALWDKIQKQIDEAKVKMETASASEKSALQDFVLKNSSQLIDIGKTTDEYVEEVKQLKSEVDRLQMME